MKKYVKITDAEMGDGVRQHLHYQGFIGRECVCIRTKEGRGKREGGGGRDREMWLKMMERRKNQTNLKGIIQKQEMPERDREITRMK